MIRYCKIHFWGSNISVAYRFLESIFSRWVFSHHFPVACSTVSPLTAPPFMALPTLHPPNDHCGAPPAGGRCRRAAGCSGGGTTTRRPRATGSPVGPLSRPGPRNPGDRWGPSPAVSPLEGASDWCAARFTDIISIESIEPNASPSPGVFEGTAKGIPSKGWKMAISLGRATGAESV